MVQHSSTTRQLLERVQDVSGLCERCIYASAKPRDKAAARLMQLPCPLSQMWDASKAHVRFLPAGHVWDTSECYLEAELYRMMPLLVWTIFLAPHMDIQ